MRTFEDDIENDFGHGQNYAQPKSMTNLNVPTKSPTNRYDTKRQGGGSKKFMDIQNPNASKIQMHKDQLKKMRENSSKMLNSSGNSGNLNYSNVSGNNDVERKSKPSRKMNSNIDRTMGSDHERDLSDLNKSNHSGKPAKRSPAPYNDQKSFNGNKTTGNYYSKNSQITSLKNNTHDLQYVGYADLGLASHKYEDNEYIQNKPIYTNEAQKNAQQRYRTKKDQSEEESYGSTNNYETYQVVQGNYYGQAQGSNPQGYPKKQNFYGEESEEVSFEENFGKGGDANKKRRSRGMRTGGGPTVVKKI